MPNGNPQPGPKFDYKLDWFSRFNRHAASLLASGHPVVLAGDYNVVPTDADIYATRSFKDNALLQPAPRAAYQALLDAGWIDALHRQSPGQAGLHVLELPAQPMAARRRDAHRPSAAEPRRGRADARGWSRPRRARVWKGPATTRPPGSS